MSVFSAGHRCPDCGTHRVERRTLHGWQRVVLPRIGRHGYRCLECERRFWDRPHRRQEYAPPPAATGRRKSRRHRHSRWRLLRRVLRRPMPLEVTPYSRPRVYLLIGLGWAAVLALFLALRAFWPAGEAVVRSIE